jgi:magnesium transporter
MDAIIDAYFPLLEAIEEEVDETEMAMFVRQDEECTLRLLRLKRSLFALRRVLHPLREIFQVFLRRDHAYFSPGTSVYFQDVYNHVLRILDVLDIERDMVTGALEAYMAVVSNRLNRTMKAIGVFTVAVAIISAVFGAYGMNFKEIPLADDPWGFWVILAGTVAVIAGLLGYFWKRGLF